MQYYINRIVLNYSLCFGLNKPVPEELLRILDEVKKKEQATSQIIMRIPVNNAQYLTFRKYLITTPPFFAENLE